MNNSYLRVIRWALRPFHHLLILLLLLPGFTQAQVFTESMGTAATEGQAITGPGSYYSQRGFDNDNEKGLQYQGNAQMSLATPSTGYAGSSGSVNVVYPTNTGAVSSFFIGDIDVLGLSNPQVSFALYIPVGGPTTITALRNDMRLTLAASPDAALYAVYSANVPYSPVAGITAGAWNLFTLSPVSMPSGGQRFLQLRFLRLNTAAAQARAYRLDDVALSATVTPTISLSPVSLSFGTQTVNTPSVEQTVDVNAVYLTQNLTVTAPAGFEVAPTGTTSFASSLTLVRNATGSINTSVDVRFLPTAVTAYVEEVTFSSAGAATGIVNVSGRGQSVPPALTTSTAGPLRFGSVTLGAASAPQNFVVSGSNLTSSVTVTAPAGFQIRQGTSQFSTAAVVLTPVNGSVNATIDVRFVPAEARVYDDAVAVASTGVSTVTVSVTGTGTPAQAGPFITAAPTLLDFQTISTSGSAQTLTFEISAGNLTAPLILTGSSGNIVFRDASAGGSLVNGPVSITPVNGSVSLRTIEVRLQGPVANGLFSGDITLTSVGATPVVVSITANNSVGGNSTINPSGNLAQFSTVPGLASAAQAYQLGATNLLQSVTVTAPQYFQVSLEASFTGITGTGNTILIPRNAGNDINPSVTIFVRFLPPTALSASSLIINASSPATSQGIPVAGTSLPSIQILTAPLEIRNVIINTTSASQELVIKADRVQQNITLSKILSSNPLNPSNLDQFEISSNNVDFASTLTLTPNQSTFSVNQSIYFRYKPTYLGTAQTTLQYQSNDFTTTTAQAFGANGLLSARSIDTEPTLRSSASVTRNGSTATVTFALPPNYAAQGYGEGRLIVASTSATLPASSQPQDGNAYATGNQTYGQGPEIAPGYYVVYSGSNQAVTIDGLTPATTYYFYTFEYNNIDNNFNISVIGTENYLSPPVPGVITGIIATGTPLPVELVSFTAQLRNAKVNLNWVTASEQDNRGFEVQRSQNGQQFSTVLFKAGRGTTSARTTYEAVDERPLPGLSYYRLKQVDTDGTFAYSPVVTVKNAGLTEASFHPNPTSGKLTISLPQAQTATALQVRITDLTGRVLRTQTLPATGEVDLSELQAGTYLVVVGSGDQQVTRKVVKN